MFRYPEKQCPLRKDSVCDEYCGAMIHSKELDASCPPGQICCTYPPIRDLNVDYEALMAAEAALKTTTMNADEEEERTDKVYTFYW